MFTNIFSGHQDVSHGVFSTGDIRFAYECPYVPGDPEQRPCCDGFCDIGSCLRLHCGVWLAPFDFGIMQNVEVLLCPSGEEKGIHRDSGVVDPGGGGEQRLASNQQGIYS